MRQWTERRHIGQFEVPGGTAHITWRLHPAQRYLSEEERSAVLEVIRRDNGVRCRIDAGVVMDDHMHVLAGFTFGTPAAKIVHSWKSITAHQLAKQFHRTAPIWQPEYYQRWIRDRGQLDICASYIRNNPRRKWPGIENYPWTLP